MARGGERLLRRHARALRQSATAARAGDARAAKGGRQRAARAARPLELLFALPPWRPAPHPLPPAARGRQRDRSARRRRAGRGRELLSTRLRAPFSGPRPRSPGAPTIRDRRCTRSAPASIAADRDLHDRVENTSGDFIWTARLRRLPVCACRTSSIGPIASCCIGSANPKPADALIFEEADPAWFLSLSSTRLGRRAFIHVHGHDSQECHVVDLDKPARRAAADRAAPAGLPLRAVRSRRHLLHQDQRRRRTRFRDRRRAGRGAGGAELAPVLAGDAGAADRDDRGVSRFPGHAGAGQDNRPRLIVRDLANRRGSRDRRSRRRPIS